MIPLDRAVGDLLYVLFGALIVCISILLSSCGGITKDGATKGTVGGSATWDWNQTPHGGSDEKSGSSPVGESVR